MKKLFFLFAIGILFLGQESFSQTQIFVEHFNYTGGVGDTAGLIYATPNWTTHSGTTPGQVNLMTSTSDTASSLKYNNEYNWYFNRSEGNRVQLTSSETEDVGRNFDVTYNTDTVYYSFLLKVTSVPTTTGTYFIHFFQGTSGSTWGGSVYIKRGSTTDYFRLGVSKKTSSSSNPGLWHEVDLNLNQTYLIIAAYVFVAGTGNDISLLWINPDTLDLNYIPTPTLISSAETSTDLSNVGRLGLREASDIGTLEIDEIRVATTWNLAPLPVELTSFAANILTDGVELNWQTATEVNNYGFDVQRSTSNDNWSSLGFVPGNGNSNSPKDYSFVDEDIKNQPNGKYYYRLKQIDTDGSYSYSTEIEVDWTNGVTDVNDDKNNLPKEYSLSQNYPNPFNPTTKIKYAIPTVGNQNAVSVKLKVYDILGNEISTLVNEVKTPGEYEVEFSGKGLSSGMYFYKIEAGNFVQVNKMILMK